MSEFFNIILRFENLEFLLSKPLESIMKFDQYIKADYDILLSYKTDIFQLYNKLETFMTKKDNVPQKILYVKTKLLYLKSLIENEQDMRQLSSDYRRAQHAVTRLQDIMQMRISSACNIRSEFLKKNTQFISSSQNVPISAQDVTLELTVSDNDVLSKESAAAAMRSKCKYIISQLYNKEDANVTETEAFYFSKNVKAIDCSMTHKTKVIETYKKLI